ncbi:helix-turn-helix domain-containing protein [Chromobacterium haemolyticum]|nr:helix-turn-helix domain-containing protein [Chromobacterium haemolyticum]
MMSIDCEAVCAYKDIYEIRRENLKALLSKRGMAAKLADSIGQFAGYLSQLKAGKRRCGSDMARKLEAAAGLPYAWLDNAHRSEVMTKSAIPSDEQFAQVIRQRGPEEVLLFMRLLLA